MADAAKKPADSDEKPPPTTVRLSRTGLIFQLGEPWPNPAGSRPLNFRVGDIFHVPSEDEDGEGEWLVFGRPVADPKTGKMTAHFGDKVIDTSGVVLVAYVPDEPGRPVSEAILDQPQAAEMVLGLKEDARAEWNAPPDEEPEPAPAGSAPRVTQ